MTPARLNEIGTALFGPSWRAALAAALGVAERTVRRWAAGDTDMPAGIDRDLAALCRRHADRLTKLAQQLLPDA
jgi:hypothetical protein